MKTITIAKSAGAEAATPEQLEKINLFTRKELSADEVHVFSVILCDNEIDRDGELFPEASLEALGELFIGKTGVFDHEPKAENQSARIFETALVHEDGENALGEPYCCLKAWAYMLRCEKNENLIREIDAGIKKEVSVGCAVESVACSICGADQKTAPCGHQKGKIYDGVVCCHRLVNPTDAYEWSFVAVPAQKKAGVTKKSRLGDIALSKLFEEERDVVLSKFELAALKSQYKQLEIMAEAGKAYLDGLRRDVVRLAALSQPDITAPALKSIAEKLSIPELLALQKSFGKTAAKQYPIAVQLHPTAEEKTAADSDNPFKI